LRPFVSVYSDFYIFAVLDTSKFEKVPSKHADHARKELMRCTERARQELMRALSVRVRNRCVHWAYASGTDAHGCLAPLKSKVTVRW